MAYRDERPSMMQKRPPSLVDLCVRTAIDNVRYLGDVGGIDLSLLEKILEHCSLDQLMHIEKSTTVTDLSPVTDKLWKNFYEKEFGTKNAEVVVERMRKKKVAFRWIQLYEAKMKDVNEAESKTVDRIKKLYEKEDARKQSRQVQLCAKVPPSSNKRSYYGSGYDVSGWKSNIMKKSKIECHKSLEVKNLTAMKKNALQRNKGLSLPTPVKPNSFSGTGAASTSIAAIKKNALQRNKGLSLPTPVKPNSCSGKGAASTSIAAKKINALQRHKGLSLPTPVKPNSFPGKGAASTSKPTNPTQRRF